MRDMGKYLMIYCLAVVGLVFLAVNLASAQQSSDVEVEVVEHAGEPERLDPAELDQMLAPIALYPDSLLSHILVAATYPLEVIQADRWREQNEDLDEEEALDAVEDKDWDPSVKALVPFADLLSKLTEDLDWLQRLGDAFLVNEDQLLTAVQSLRRKAYDNGSLQDNEYVEVVEEEEDIIIQPVREEIVYVPYYDTRYVYGPWWWTSHPPLYWHRPAHYYWHAGFYWSPRVYIRPSYFWGGFHWRKRHLVVNHHYYHKPRRYHDGHKRVTVREYQRWQHNPNHRRGVRYRHSGAKSVYQHNKRRDVVIRDTQRTVVNRNRQVEVHKQPQRKVSRNADYVNRRLNNDTRPRNRSDKPYERVQPRTQTSRREDGKLYRQPQQRRDVKVDNYRQPKREYRTQKQQNKQTYRTQNNNRSTQQRQTVNRTRTTQSQRNYAPQRRTQASNHRSSNRTYQRSQNSAPRSSSRGSSQGRTKER